MCEIALIPFTVNGQLTATTHYHGDFEMRAVTGVGMRKFHYLGEDGLEPSIPYEKILPVVKETGFDGWLICEYEDEMFCGGTEFTKKMFELERKVLEEA